MDSDAFQRPSLMLRKSHRSTEADKDTAEKDTEIKESQDTGKTKAYNGKVIIKNIAALSVIRSYTY